MSAQVQPTTFALAMERELREARVLLESCQRCAERAMAVHGTTRVLDLGHLVLTHCIEDIDEFLRDLAPLIAAETALAQPATDVLEGD